MVYKNPGTNDPLHKMPSYAFDINMFDKTQKSTLYNDNSKIR